MPAISIKGKLNASITNKKNWCLLLRLLKKNGTKVFHLNIGQPDINTPQVALDAVKNNAIKVLSYARSEGSEEYRTKLANYYAKKRH